MPKPITVAVGNSDLTINTGDLTADTIAQFANGELSLASDVLGAVLAQPISSLSSDKLEASVTAGSPLSWGIGPITLTFSPSVQGALTIRRAGEIFRYTEAENDDD